MVIMGEDTSGEKCINKLSLQLICWYRIAIITINILGDKNYTKLNNNIQEYPVYVYINRREWKHMERNMRK